MYTGEVAEEQPLSTEHDTPAAAHESAAVISPAAGLARAPAEAPGLAIGGLAARLAQPEIQGPGNGPVRQAAIVQLQQTHGNRATQRLLHRQPAAPDPPPVQRTAEVAAAPAPRVAVQRDTPAPAADQQQVENASPTPLRTIDDLITLVQHVESAYPGDNWQGITTRIRKAYYDGFLWDSMIKDREAHKGLTTPPLTAPDYKAFATAKDHPEITVNGASIDIGHVFTGLDAMNFPKTGTIMGAAGVEGPPGATWGGDVGSALAEWDLSSPKDRARRLDFYKKFASSDDMLGDVDGIALSAPPAAGASSGTLSERLRTYYKGTAGAAAGVSQRFTKFAQASGFTWTGRGGGIQLDSAAKDHIRRQIDTFGVQWRRKRGGQTGANWFHDEDLDWFRDQFVTWVQQGLAAENP